MLRVTIDRPDDPLNAVDATMHEELARLFRTLKRERTARAVLLTGTGRAFSAGGDFRWFPELQAPGALEELRLDARQMIWDLLDVALPIVCAINGHAIGLGASVALLCDVIFMAESATLADPHVRVGLVAGDGGTIAWPLAVGPARAKQYLLTGDALSAAEAERIGLVNQVVADGDLDAEALAFAHRLAALPPLAVQHTKAAVNNWMKESAMASFDLATASEISTFRSADHAEALTAFARNDHPASSAGDRPMTSPAKEPPVDLLEGIMTTRAMRRYTDAPVSDDEIWTCLRAAVQAPSGGNIQPYQFVVVRDPALKTRLGEVYRRAWDRYGAATTAAIGDRFPSDEARQAWERNVAASDHLARHLGEAPALVLVLMPDIEMTVTDDEGVMDVGPTYASVYPAVQNFVLAARPGPGNGADHRLPHPRGRGPGDLRDPRALPGGGPAAPRSSPRLVRRRAPAPLGRAAHQLGSLGGAASVLVGPA